MATKESSNIETMHVAFGDEEIVADVGQFHTHCFGFCCDFRKAVIAVNGTNLVLQTMTMIVIGISARTVFGESMNDAIADIDDDVTKQAMEEFSSGGGAAIVGFMEVVIFIGVIFTSIGIFGALKFNRCALITTSVFYSLSVLSNVLSFNSGTPLASLGNIIFSALLLYPHVCFLILMDKGIMTPENYHRVAKCC